LSCYIPSTGGLGGSKIDSVSESLLLERVYSGLQEGFMIYFRRMSAVVKITLISLLFLSSGALAESVFPGEQWEISTPEGVGMDAQKLQAFVNKASTSIKATGAIVRDGKMISQWGDISRIISWTSAWKPQNSYCLFFCIQEGLIGGVDDSIAPFVPEAYQGKMLIEKDRGMTFGHLANQISGYSFVERPGESFSYNDAATATASNILSAAIQRTYPEKNWRSYLSDNLSLLKLADGLSSWMSVRDQCRIAWWCCNKGEWNGKQILASHFFDTYTRPLVPQGLPHSTGEDPHGTYLSQNGVTRGYDAQGVYGYWWWFNNRECIDTTIRSGRIEYLFKGLPNDAYATFGYGNNYVIVMPRLRMVVACNPYSGGPDDWSLLIDAVDDADQTPPDIPSAPHGNVVPSGEIHLVWNAVEDYDGTVDAYWVYRDGAFLAEIDATQSRYVDQNIRGGQHYTYEIQAFNASGFASRLSGATEFFVPDDITGDNPMQRMTEKKRVGPGSKIKINNDIVYVNGDIREGVELYDCKGRLFKTSLKNNAYVDFGSIGHGLYVIKWDVNTNLLHLGPTR